MRNKTIDIFRGISIILVICAHALQMGFIENNGKIFDTNIWFTQWKIIYSFHMPAFYFVSGMVRNINNHNILKSSMFYMVVAIVFNLIFSIFFVAPTNPDKFFKTIHSSVTLSGFNLAIVWFLVSIAIIQMAFHIIMKSPLNKKVAYILTALLINAIALKTNVSFFQLQTIIPGLFFYALGYFFNEKFKNFEQLSFSKNTFLFTIALLSVITYYTSINNQGCYFEPSRLCPSYHGQFAVLFIYGQYGFFPYFVISSISGIMLIYTISKTIERSKIGHLLYCIGQRTLGIMLVNGFFLGAIQPFIIKIDPNLINDIWKISLIIIATIVIQVVFYRTICFPIDKITALIKNRISP